MSMIDRTRLYKMYKILRSDQQMDLLNLMYKDKPYSYSMLKDEYYKMHNQGSIDESGKFAYHLRKLKILNLVKKQEGYYFLTRAGIALLGLLRAFERKCVNYELDECEADGMIKHFVKRDDV